jgi:hypothetical protein
VYPSSDGVTPSRSAPFTNNDASLCFPLARVFPREGIPLSWFGSLGFPRAMDCPRILATVSVWGFR